MVTTRTTRSNGRKNNHETREFILETAVKVTNRLGLQGLTIGGLAKAVGMSKSGLFAHFNSKDNLQLMVLKMATENFIKTVLSPAFKKPRGEQRVRGIFENWQAYMDESASLPGGSILIAATIELADQPGPCRDYIKKIKADLLANIVKATKLSKEEGHFHKDLDIDLFAWKFYSLILGFHYFKHILERPKTTEFTKISFDELIEYAKKNRGKTL